MIKVVFLGTADFGLPTLQALHDSADIELVGVITQPDKPVGRKQQLTPSPVKVLAKELQVSIYEQLDDLLTLTVDVGVLVAYGHLLKDRHLNHCAAGILNIHPSLLPAWRGPAPIQYSLLNGDTITGITIMRIDAGMDTGPIITQQSYDVQLGDTAESLHEYFSKVGGTMLLDVIEAYVNGDATITEQSANGASYSHIITREDGRVTSKDSEEAIFAKWRAFHPWPGVFLEWQDKRIKLIDLSYTNNVLQLRKVQVAGKQPVSFEEFKNGYPEFLLADIV